MDSPLPKDSDGDVFIYYNYHSVPIPPEKIDYLAQYVCNELGRDYQRFFFCCDVRATSKEVLEAAEIISKSEICHMNGNVLESSLCDRIKWHSKMFNTRGAEIVLISDHGQFGGTLTHVSRLGWRVAIFHPPNTNSSFLDYADEAYALPIHRNSNEQAMVPIVCETTGVQDSRIANMAEDVRQGLAQLLNRLSGAMGPPPGGNQNQPRMASVTSTQSSITVENENINMGFVDDRHYEIPTESSDYDTNSQCQMLNAPAFVPASPQFAHSAPPPAMNGFNNPQMGPQSMGMNMQPQPMYQEQHMAPRITPEKKNPFQQQNPFKSQQPAANQDGWDNYGYQEEAAPVGPLVTRIGGKRNPFASGPPQMNTKFNNNNNNVNKEFRNDMSFQDREKFRKPAPQCPLWEDRCHKESGTCNLWHPYKLCTFFPNCRTGAPDCGYAHPFCGNGECFCDESNRDPQFNHEISERIMY